MLPQRLSAYGYLYSYRKALWNTPLRLLYWLHGSSLISVRVRKLNARAPPCRIYRRLSDDTGGDCRFFTADLLRYDTARHAMFIFYLYDLNLYLIVEGKLLASLLRRNFSEMYSLSDYKTREKIVCMAKKHIILLFVLFLYF